MSIPNLYVNSYLFSGLTLCVSVKKKMGVLRRREELQPIRVEDLIEGFPQEVLVLLFFTEC